MARVFKAAMSPRGIAALAGLIGFLSWHAMAAEPTTTDLQKKLDVLDARVRQLEKDKADLEKSLSGQYISEDEPDLSARLKAVESQANSYKKAVNTMEGLEGIKTNAGLTMLGQSLQGSVPSGQKDGELNYRADVTVTLPGGEFGNANGIIFTHFRMGQGLGLETPNNAFSSVNATSFQRPGNTASDSTVLLAQLWYQLNVPLPLGGNPGLSRSHLEFNIGKMDPFGFFDQNDVADDESRGFINQAFVHNPLLDIGGDVGVDDFGFTPGMRIAYINESSTPQTYAFSVGIFATGNGASYNDSFGSSFAIAQFDTHQRFFGSDGNYRLYVWRNTLGTDYDGTGAEHSGVGISMDQHVGDYTKLFARYGHQLQGKVRFDQALTVGAEFGGSYWNRGADAIGVALGWLKISDDFHQDSLTVDANGDSVPDYGYQADGAEQVAELYYRYHFNKEIALSPNLQLIRHPGGNSQASDVKAAGLRLQIDY
ncbi:MAG: carbohydrate porin [Gammaproteobacteria bacterium]|nr:carbohydrate porin [Gammaproteobacteria bacterium]